MFLGYTKSEKVIAAILLTLACLHEYFYGVQNPHIKKAGVELVVGVISAVIFVGAAAFAFLQSQPKQDGLEPQALDSFGMTQAKEGTPVPILYGLNRVPGNILFYGNLVTREIYQKVSGGKGGGGSSKQLVGYEYRIDVWQSVGLTSPGNSRIELLETYIDDELDDPEVADTVYNDGTLNVFPSFVTEGGKLPNVAHIGYEQIFLGENRTQLPVIHFITKTFLDTGLSNENTDDGNNPAAVIYDLLLLSANIKASEVDFDSFETAANYWHSVGYSCSLKISSVKEILQVINNILNTFPGVLYVNGQGKIVLKAFDPLEAATWTITNSDHKDIKFQRQTYVQMNNDFSAKYVDKDLAFTERHVGAANDAVIELVQERKPANFDLSFMRTAEMASRRIDELMKNESYPKAMLNFTANLKFRSVNPGDVVEFSNTRLGIVSMFIRVMSVSRPALGSNEVKIKAVEMTERLFDSEFVNTFESTPSGVGNPIPLVEIRDVFEVPYNPIRGFNPVIFMIVERINGVATGFDIGYSSTRTPTPPAIEVEFNTMQRFLSFSLKGTLDQNFDYDKYFDETLTGIVFTPGVTFYPEFDSEQLLQSYYSNTRYILIGSELITFATITPLGGGSFRLTGLRRGVFGTRIRSTYTAGTPIIIFNVLDNILDEGKTLSNFSRIQATGLFTTKAQLPPLDTFDTMNDRHSTMVGVPTYYEVVKVGTSLDFKVYPVVNANAGFGTGTPNTVIPRSTRDMPPNGKIRVFYNKNETVYNDFTSVDFNDTAPTSGSVEINMQVIEVRDGSENRSQYTSFTIPAGDGTYIFNTRSKWSRKIYDGAGKWIPTYIGDINNE